MRGTGRGVAEVVVGDPLPGAVAVALRSVGMRLTAPAGQAALRGTAHTGSRSINAPDAAQHPRPSAAQTSNRPISKRVALDWKLAVTSGMESGAIGVVPARMKDYRKVWIPDGAPSRIDYHSGGLESGSRA